VNVERAQAPRTRPRQWREILAFALAQRDAIGVRGTVIDHLHRMPRERRSPQHAAAHGIAASGQAKSFTSDRLDSTPQAALT
jgi:hypothetical protein